MLELWYLNYSNKFWPSILQNLAPGDHEFYESKDAGIVISSAVTREGLPTTTLASSSALKGRGGATGQSPVKIYSKSKQGSGVITDRL